MIIFKYFSLNKYGILKISTCLLQSIFVILKRITYKNHSKNLHTTIPNKLDFTEK